MKKSMYMSNKKRYQMTLWGHFYFNKRSGLVKYETNKMSNYFDILLVFFIIVNVKYFLHY